MMLLYWFGTLIGSVFIASVFIVQYLESKYKPYVRALEADIRALSQLNERLIDADLILQQRYRTLRAEQMGQAKDGTE